MSSIVYYGSPRQARLAGEETLPAKLDLILERLKLRQRVKGETVAIKVHTGGSLSYSTLHPVFIRKVVQVVLEGGGHPFVTDVRWNIEKAETRGYSAEALGCPVFPTSGLDDKYAYTHHRPYRNIQDWKVAGMIQDASFLVNFAHAKGHPACGYGAAIKNIALGCVVGETRRAIHDTNHFAPYWFGELCPDEETRKRIMEACPFGALVEDHEHPGGVHLHTEECNQCMRCMQVAPPGSLKITADIWDAFMEANAISTAITMGTFAPEKMTHLVLATHMTPVCDCFGFTSMPVLRDAGIFGSDDILAVDQAFLDVSGRYPLIEENVPTSMEIHTRSGHPFRWLHGPFKDPNRMTELAELHGLGSRQYELVDVLPVEEFTRRTATYISAT